MLAGLLPVSLPVLPPGVPLPFLHLLIGHLPFLAQLYRQLYCLCRHWLTLCSAACYSLLSCCAASWCGADSYYAMLLVSSVLSALLHVSGLQPSGLHRLTYFFFANCYDFSKSFFVVVLQPADMHIAGRPTRSPLCCGHVVCWAVVHPAVCGEGAGLLRSW